MASPSPQVQAALASLRERWGGAAPRWGGEVRGALAIAPQRAPADEGGGEPGFVPGRRPLDERGIPSGFPELDEILGLGGLPRAATTSLAGSGTSGKTTLALRVAAQVQATGGIAAYLDLARSLDPVEAAARGVQLDWLVVLTPASLEEALAMAAALLQDRAVDLLLLDLSLHLDAADGPVGRLADRLHRLSALARRAGVQLLAIEPPELPSPIRAALAESAGLRLELRRRGWLRLGRDVVGQRTEVRVARSRFGPPGRTAEIRILYAEGVARDACLSREELLQEGLRAGRLREAATRVDVPHGIARPEDALGEDPPPDRQVPASRSRPGLLASLPSTLPIDADATPPPLLAPPPPPARPRPILHAVAGRADRPRRAALDGRDRARREPGRARAGSAAGHAARERPPARP